MSELKALLKLITTGVERLQAECDSRNIVFPPLDEPFTPEVQALQMEMLTDVITVVAAANQLAATVQLSALTALGTAASVR